MVTLAELESWQPDQLSTVADGLNTDRKALIDVQDEMWGAKPPDSWIGDAAVAAKSAHDTLVADLNDIAAGISPVIAALDSASSAISSAKESAMSARSTAVGRGWRVEASGSSVTISPAPGAEDEEGDEAERQQLADQIAQALQDATTADEDLAAVLTSSKRGSFDGGTGTISDASLPPELQGLSTPDLVERLLEDPEAYASYTDALPEYQQQALGEELARRWDELNVENPAMEGTSPYGDYTDAEIARLNQLTEAYGEDPTVATSIANELGPEGITRIQNTLISQSGLGYDPNPLSPDTIGDAQEAWGGVLAAATSGTSSDGDAGSADHVSGEWVQSLLEAGDQEYAYNSTGGATAFGHQLLGPLLASEGHGSYFLNEAGDHIEQFEHDWMEENEGYGSPWDKGDDPFQLDYRHGEIEPGDPWYNLPTGHDPIGGLMEGLSHNPEASRDFFANTDGPYGERIEHYLQEREWPRHEALVNGAPEGYPSSIRYFGDALVSATTGAPPTEVSADLAETAVRVGSQEDLPTDGLRQDFAQIIGGYTPDVFDSLSGGQNPETGDGDPWIPGEQDPGLQADFDEHELRKLLSDVGEDEAARHHVEGSAAVYADLGYDHYYSGAADGPGSGDDLNTIWDSRHDGAVAHVSNPYAEILGATREGLSEDELREQVEHDRRVNAEGDAMYGAGGYIADQLIDNTAGKVPFVGGFLSDAGQAGVGAGVEHLQTMNDVDTSAETRTEIGRQLADTSGGAQALAENAVYRNLPDAVLDDYRGSDGSPVFTDGQGNRIPMSEWGPEQRDAWEQARESTGPAGHAGGLSQDLENQIVTGQSQTDQESGE